MKYDAESSNITKTEFIQIERHIELLKKDGIDSLTSQLGNEHLTKLREEAQSLENLAGSLKGGTFRKSPDKQDVAKLRKIVAETIDTKEKNASLLIEGCKEKLKGLSGPEAFDVLMTFPHFEEYATSKKINREKFGPIGIDSYLGKLRASFEFAGGRTVTNPAHLKDNDTSFDESAAHKFLTNIQSTSPFNRENAMLNNLGIRVVDAADHAWQANAKEKDDKANTTGKLRSTYENSEKKYPEINQTPLRVANFDGFVGLNDMPRKDEARPFIGELSALGGTVQVGGCLRPNLSPRTQHPIQDGVSLFPVSYIENGRQKEALIIFSCDGSSDEGHLVKDQVIGMMPKKFSEALAEMNDGKSDLTAAQKAMAISIAFSKMDKEMMKGELKGGVVTTATFLEAMPNGGYQGVSYTPADIYPALFKQDGNIVYLATPNQKSGVVFRMEEGDILATSSDGIWHNANVGDLGYAINQEMGHKPRTAENLSTAARHITERNGAGQFDDNNLTLVSLKAPIKMNPRSRSLVNQTISDVETIYNTLSKKNLNLDDRKTLEGHRKSLETLGKEHSPLDASTQARMDALIQKINKLIWG